MRHEIERKYLLSSDYFTGACATEHFMSMLEKDAISRKEIVQTYISYEPEVRVRKVLSSTEKEPYYTLTVKSTGDIERQEYERRISKEAYKDLMSDALATLNKIRYTIEIPNNKAFVDCFIEDTGKQGLTLIEVEFNSLTQAENFIEPKWFGKEVTYDPFYKNKNMAKLSQEKREEGVI